MKQINSHAYYNKNFIDSIEPGDIIQFEFCKFVIVSITGIKQSRKYFVEPLDEISKDTHIEHFFLIKVGFEQYQLLQA